MAQVVRYHPLLVALHWLVALMILGALGVGFFVLANMPNTDPVKVDVLRIHMAVGFGILVLMILRAFVRMGTERPEAATTGFPLLDRFAPLTHYGFYLVVLLMVGSGFGLSFAAGLPAIVFGHSGEPLPKTFETYAPFKAHAALALILAALVALHLVAALYHQFVRKDGLFARMWFGQRT